MDLFSSAAEDRLRTEGPLAARMRPRSIDDVVGHSHLLAAGMPIRRLVEGGRIPSMILWGPPGTGKTSIALAIAGTSSCEFVQLSAVTAGVKDVRHVIDEARERLGARGRRTILFLDEIHRFTSTQQDALLPAVEEGIITLVGATTENPSFQVNPALLSRSAVFRLDPLNDDAIRLLVLRGARTLQLDVQPDAIEEVIRRSAGDGRRALVLLETGAALSIGSAVTLEEIERASGSLSLRYGVDDHYDVISAFIKSMRAGDPQATIVYLARMIAAGEDPRFIARRMVVFASEDVGLAEPGALAAAVGAAQALDIVGLPEAQLNLAQAALHLALAPKSRSVAEAIWSARSDVERGLAVEVPPHLRGARYPGENVSGQSDSARGPIEPKPMLPPELQGRIWYVPSNAGFEGEIRSRMKGSAPEDGGSRAHEENRP